MCLKNHTIQYDKYSAKNFFCHTYIFVDLYFLNLFYETFNWYVLLCQHLFHDLNFILYSFIETVICPEIIEWLKTVEFLSLLQWSLTLSRILLFVSPLFGLCSLHQDIQFYRQYCFHAF